MRPEPGSLSGEELSRLTGGRQLRRIVYSAEEIADRVGEMGAAIARAYPEGEELLVLGLLKGSFVFLADLVRCIDRPLHVDFLVVASYGSGTETSGDVRTLYDPSAPMAGRHVVLVEDIVDSGTTVNQIVPALRERGVASMELCTLLHKRVAGEMALEPRWVGFDAPDEFLVGYGLDHAEDFRHLPFIASI